MLFNSGPLESTAEDFWRMIWDQKCLVIAMTTRLTENKRQKCFQYWKLNAGEDVVHGNVEIKTVSVETSQDFSITLLEISNLRVIRLEFKFLNIQNSSYFSDKRNEKLDAFLFHELA